MSRKPFIKPRYVDEFFLSHNAKSTDNIQSLKTDLFGDDTITQKNIMNHDVPIQNLSNADSSLAMKLVGEESFAIRRNVLSRILISLLSIFRIFRLIRNKDFSGFIIGKKYKEYGIKLNQNIILFGDIFYDKAKKKFFGI